MLFQNRRSFPASPRSDTLQVEVWDATTGSWSAPGTLTAATTAPHTVPTVSLKSLSVAENNAVSESAVFSGIAAERHPSSRSLGRYDGKLVRAGHSDRDHDS